MDNFLSDLIEERLVEKHHLELRRIPCAVRIELAQAMGLLHPSDRGVYLQLNALRNRFAHEPGTAITEKDALDLYNGIGERLRTIFKVDYSSFSNPSDFVRRIAAIIIVELDGTLSGVRDRKRWDMALMQEIMAVAAEPVSNRHLWEGRVTDVHRRIQKHYDDLKASEQ